MKFVKTLVCSFSAVALSVASVVSADDSKVDPALPTYQKVSGVSGNLSSIGSDTLNNLMTFWAEAFRKEYPNVNVQIEGKGSSTAPPALTEATATFGPMSRAMKANEIAAFEAKHGYKPTKIAVAIDALAVFVHKDNPIKGLSMQQVDAIFSKNRKCGADKGIDTWGDAGVSGNLAKEKITMYGRNSVSGTYGYFKEEALCKGDFKDTVAEQPGSASVVQSIAGSLNAIGYSGIGYKTSGVRALPLSDKDFSGYVEASPENAIEGKYPLSRFLYVYVNKKPNQPLAPLEAEFIKMVMSKQGQEIVVKDGYIPLPASVAAKQVALIK
ncbi:PstS family phosphate ABC transporter substrate-binding protein [Permianibacter aggregans]|uniref:Phosphate-binding protein n=1 Tax=Permianibacter aggregans TaxID=1510150 RepID=A0A4R6UXH6_9GAMM|nr:phosphate ABC transporter substrate-binding protein [Permianibacter aggregans]QGX40877.1 phosphate ABC transporter substrate-binding protein [Permianibacter aggregans]TDQ48304.1 phosphate ABC transporter substrate-binding protein (PhoT family) [Permianibacter aggregans]